MPGDLEELRSLARRLHVHFDVEPELDLQNGARVRVGLLVRLWGVHAKGAGALPGCTKCHEIVSRLKLILEYALDRDTSMHVAVEPFRRALYDSRVIPGADEVALAIRISSPGAQGAATQERFLKALRARLRELGVPER